jgi:hypothetical protein
MTIVRVPSGGIPVTESPSGLPYYDADNGFGIAATFVSQGGRPIAGASLTSNLKKSNTANIRSAFASGGGAVSIAFGGDSTEAGIDETSVPYNAQLNTHSMPAVLAGLLQAVGTNAGANNAFGCTQTLITDLVARDGRFGFTGATVAGSVVTAGGSSIAMPAAGTLTFTPTGNVTKFDIWTYDDAATRTISWAVDGGAATNITTTGVSRAQKTTVSAGAAGIHTLTLTWVAGSNHILALVGYDDTAGRKEVSCLKWGIPGATTTSCINNTNAPQGGRLQALTTYAPKLLVTECGLINSWRNGISVATATSDITTLVQAAQAVGCDVILKVPPYDNGSTGNTAQQGDYVTAMYAVAASLNVPVFDIRKRWRSYTNAVANGWQVGSDAVHPTAAGYADCAAALLPVISYALAA